jgi:hypothetical protein
MTLQVYCDTGALVKTYDRELWRAAKQQGLNLFPEQLP